MARINGAQHWLKHQSSFNSKLFPPFWKLIHVASLQFLPSGQYGLCFGYCFSGPLPLRSHNGQVTFLEPFPRVPSHLDYTQKLARTILALKLSVSTTSNTGGVATTPATRKVNSGKRRLDKQTGSLAWFPRAT